MNVLRIAACLFTGPSGINFSGQDNTSASPQTVSEVFDKSVSAAERGTKEKHGANFASVFLSELCG